MKKLWSIPIALGYLYAITILTQAGYEGYFNIPVGFTSASITNNTINAYVLFRAILWSIIMLKWWWLLIAPILFVVGFISHIYFNGYKKVFVSIGTIIAIVFLYNAHGYGAALAERRTDFLVLSPGCPPIGPDGTYLVVDFYEGKAIFAPFDPNTKKLGDGFLLRELSIIPCKLQSQEIGPIVR